MSPFSCSPRPVRLSVSQVSGPLPEAAVSNAKTVYERRLERGVCIRCEGPRDADAKFKTCLACRETMRASRRSLGRSLMCAQCKAPVSKGKLCEKCRKKVGARKKATYRSRVAAGLCPQCGKKRGKKAETKLCSRCLKRIKKNSGPKAKARREQRKAAGVCAKCGDRPAIPDTTHCFECRDKTNEGHRRRRRLNPKADAERSKKFREDMIAKGLCYKCAQPAAKDRTRCDDCLEKEADSRRAGRARKKLAAAKDIAPDPVRSQARPVGRLAEEPSRILRA